MILSAIINSETDTSADVTSKMLEASQKTEIGKALQREYPDVHPTITANHYSRLFQEFEKYHPSGVVQYSITKTNDTGRQLLITILFDRYYEYTLPSIIVVQCTGMNYSSLLVTGQSIGASEIEKC